MATKSITVRVNAEAARIFETASEEEKRKIEALLSLKLCSTKSSLLIGWLNVPVCNITSPLHRNGLYSIVEWQRLFLSGEWERYLV